MIGKPEILSRAAEWSLRPDVVEKDYALGWMLAAVSLDEETSDGWILKGGTCVKKCFIETYRFSEDLDFSLRPDVSYDVSAIERTLTRLAALVGEMCGIAMPHDQIVVKERRDKLGRPTFEGRIGYRGPLQAPNWPRILFDITQHEPIIEEPVLRRVLHPYSDALPEDAVVRTYSFEELLAEKTRALLERTRPRDLYDVVYITTNVEGIDVSRLRMLFRSKCAVKQLTAPSRKELVDVIMASAELRAEWANMLAHQLQELLPIDGVLERIDEALAWIDERVTRVREALVSPPTSVEGVVMSGTAPRGLGGPIERLRFAGANRLLVEFTYRGKPRRAEPYSLRIADTGNLLLYAHELASGIVKSFKVAEIVGLRTTQTTFTPRYAIELGFAPVASSRRPSIEPARSAVSRPRRTGVRTGPVYVFQCPLCGKKFRRKKHDTRLRRHNLSNTDVPCGGRSGVLVGTG